MTFILVALLQVPAPTDPDFAVDGLNQTMSDGTLLPVGGVTDETLVYLWATVGIAPGASPSLIPAEFTLEFQIRPQDQAFNNTLPDYAADTVLDAPAFAVALDLQPGVSYKWRVRATYPDGVTGWSMIGAIPHFSVSDASSSATPPSNLCQKNSAGATLPNGGVTAETSITLCAVPVAPPAPLPTDPIQVEFQYREIAAVPLPFTTISIYPSDPDLEVSASINGLVSGKSYEWRVRNVFFPGSPMEFPSAWVILGPAPNFSVQAGAVDPNPPASLAQRRLDGTPIAIGGSTSESRFIASANLSDPLNDLLRLEVEFRATNVPFTGTPNAVSALAPAGAVQLEVGISPFGLDTFHWRARTAAQDGRRSAWVDFGSNPAGAVDLRRAPPPPGKNNSFAPPSPRGHSSGGSSTCLMSSPGVSAAPLLIAALLALALIRK